MKILIFTLTVISLSLQFRMESSPNDINWPFSSCNTDGIKFTSLTLTDKPVRSKNITAYIKGIANSNIQISTVEIELLLSTHPLYILEDPWKAEFKSGEVINYDYTFSIPSFYNAGIYTLVIEFIDYQPQQVGCLKFQFTL